MCLRPVTAIALAIGCVGCAPRSSPERTGCVDRPDRSPEAASPAPEERPYATEKRVVRKPDPRTGIEHMVLQDVMLVAGDRGVALDMMASNIIEWTIIPESTAAALQAETLGYLDLPEPRAAPETLIFLGQSQPARITLPGPVEKPIEIDAPEHLRVVYGMNRTAQRRFRVVRVERADLGVGPPFGPVTALVSHDENSAIGLIGGDWLRHMHDGAGYVISSDAIHFMTLP